MSEEKRPLKFKQLLIWSAALLTGAILGSLGIGELNSFFDFIASIYTRLFKLAAVPTIALAVFTTLATLGKEKNTGKIFLYTITFTLLTTFAAALLAAGLYITIQPGQLSTELMQQGTAAAQSQNLAPLTVYSHLLKIFPDNLFTPFIECNVLSILLIAGASGLAVVAMNHSENVQTLLKCILGMQEMLFALIKALIYSLPLGIVAFSAQLAAQIAAGQQIGGLGKYVAVVLSGNIIQFFVILPVFLLLNRLNPWKVFRAMLPAVLMALFTKSSAATLPVTVASAENNLRAKKEVARFVLPMCCTINMNGCAAFILVTSLFVMQNGGVTLDLSTIMLWVLIAVISAVGNAGVPMGCYFLTLSLMAGINMPIWVMGVILPIYAVIDMIETAVNVWSDGCVCAMVDKHTK